jgi:hypothetical protein
VFQKKDLKLSGLIYIYSENKYSDLNCHNGAKHIEFYLRYMVQCDFKWQCRVFQKSFAMRFKMLLCGECNENVYT